MLNLAIAADEDSKITNAAQMFQGLPVEELDLSKLDMSQCISTKQMFYDCRNLRAIKGHWNLSNVVDATGMFGTCLLLTELAATNWRLSNKLTKVSYMFGGCTNLTSINGTADWDLSGVSDASNMFNGSGITGTLDASSWNFSNKLTNTSFMFAGCTNLTSITGTGSWDLSGVSSTSYMFYNSGITGTLDATNWKFSNKLTDTSIMFGGCENLTSIIGTGDWDLSNVSDAQGMFNSSGITGTLDATNWNFRDKLTNTSNMFGGCRSLTSIAGIGDWELSNVSDMRFMFHVCTNLTELDATAWKLTNLPATIQLGESMSPSARWMFRDSGLTTLTINGQALKKLIAAGAIEVDRSEYGDYVISESYGTIMTFKGAVSGDKFVIRDLEKYRVRDNDQEWQFPEVNELIE